LKKTIKNGEKTKKKQNKKLEKKERKKEKGKKKKITNTLILQKSKTLKQLR